MKFKKGDKVIYNGELSWESGGVYTVNRFYEYRGGVPMYWMEESESGEMYGIIMHEYNMIPYPNLKPKKYIKKHEF